MRPVSRPPGASPQPRRPLFREAAVLGARAADLRRRPVPVLLGGPLVVHAETSCLTRPLSISRASRPSRIPRRAQPRFSPRANQFHDCRRLGHASLARDRRARLVCDRPVPVPGPPRRVYLVLSMTIFPQIAMSARSSRASAVPPVRPVGALILTYLIFTLPFTVWVLTSFMRAMPADLEEAAYVDGATPLQAFCKVLLPLIAPGLVTTGLLAFIAAWNEYLYRALVRPDADQYTVPLAITSFMGKGGPSRSHGVRSWPRRSSDGAADRGDTDPAETDPGRPDRGRRQGLDRVARSGRRSRAGSCRRRARSRCPRRSATSG